MTYKEAIELAVDCIGFFIRMENDIRMTLEIPELHKHDEKVYKMREAIRLLQTRSECEGLF